MNRRNFLKMLGGTIVGLAVKCKGEDGKVDPLIKPAEDVVQVGSLSAQVFPSLHMDLSYLIKDDFDAVEDVGGIDLQMDPDPWEDTSSLAVYTDGKWLIAMEKQDGILWTHYSPLLPGEWVNVMFRSRDGGIHCIVVGPNYTRQVVYAAGAFTERTRIMHTTKPFSTYDPDSTPASWYPDGWGSDPDLTLDADLPCQKVCLSRVRSLIPSLLELL